MSQLQLLEAAALSWLPDETAYSLASRFHRLTGLSSAGQTCKLLFGIPRPATLHDFTAGLRHFCEVTEGRMGDAHSIAARRTVLGFFLPFQIARVQQRALRALTENGIGSLKFQLGVQTGRFGSHFPLKACPKCIADDERVHHVAYWHRIHQVPGVWICLTHGQVLQECTQRSSLHHRFDLVLPKANLLAPSTPMDVTQRTEAQHLASITADLLEMPVGFTLDLGRVARTVRSAIADRTSSAFRYSSEAVTRYSNCCLDLRFISELSNLPRDEARARRDLEYLIRNQRVRPHPVRWMVALSCFFSKFSEFLEDYGRIASNNATLRIEEAVQSRTARAISIRSGVSMRQLAQEAGVDVSTAMAHAARVGVQPSSRPKKLRGELRVEALDLLRAGTDKSVVARQIGVSTGTITRLLLTEVGLHDEWADSRLEAKRAKARHEWMLAIKYWEPLGIKECRSRVPAAYSWLRRNDRPWLDKTVSKLRTSRARTNNSHVRWDERDADFARQVKHAREILGAACLPEIVNLVPALRPKLRKLHLLPLTAAALRDASASRKRNSVQRELFRND